MFPILDPPHIMCNPASIPHGQLTQGPLWGFMPVLSVSHPQTVSPIFKCLLGETSWYFTRYLAWHKLQGLSMYMNFSPLLQISKIVCSNGEKKWYFCTLPQHYTDFSISTRTHIYIEQNKCKLVFAYQYFYYKYMFKSISISIYFVCTCVSVL